MYDCKNYPNVQIRPLQTQICKKKKNKIWTCCLVDISIKIIFFTHLIYNSHALINFNTH